MPTSDTHTPRRSHARRTLHVLASPYFRYRHAKFLHALRVALAMLASIGLTSGINLPHGVWATVTLLVVIGGLQHHGNIRKKAAERALGTLLGAGLGLTLIIVQSIFGSLLLTFLLMAAIAGACSYYAIGKAGYVALLTAITMVIVAGHGDLPFEVGLWRTANVLIGIVIALGFSFVLPLYATYSWRYRLADNMRDTARLYAALIEGKPFDPDELTQRFLVMTKRLVQARSLMESVAKEIDVPVAALDEIQRLHRSILAALEMLATSGPLERQLVPAEVAACTAEERAVRQSLLLMARALRFGRVGLLHAAAYTLDVQPGMARALPDPNAHGVHWLAMRLAELVNQLRLRLIEIERHWNIEHAQPFYR